MAGATDLSKEEQERVLSEAIAMYAAGDSWRKISRDLGVCTEWFKRRILPGYAEKENKRTSSKFRQRDRTVSKAPIEAVSKPIPRPFDTRDLTGRLLGDPIFVRSALFQKQQGESA